ncbi:MAG: hypothetical protein M0C28_00360 [Candidatus Moduliflexus flocculans]|nr:hypothetical protein [Candidatus Moduliflexus flocculans]
MKNIARLLAISILGALCSGASSAPAAESRGVEHGKRYDRLVIRNVLVIDGKGTPMRGPLDVDRRGGQDRLGHGRRRAARGLQGRSARPRRHGDVPAARLHRQPHPPA